MDIIEQAKEVFLTGVDEDTRKENLADITNWEQSILENQAYIDWQAHDITKSIVRQVKETYLDASVQLSKLRVLSEDNRNKLYATQDACIFILSLTERDAKAELESLENDVRKKIRQVM
jgi:hypothetical protein